MKSLERLMDSLGTAVGQVAALDAGLDSIGDKVEGFRDWLRDERDARRLHDSELDRRLDSIESDQRAGRRAIIVALIAATGTIMAALIAGYFTLKGAR